MILGVLFGETYTLDDSQRIVLDFRNSSGGLRVTMALRSIIVATPATVRNRLSSAIGTIE